MNRQMPQAKVHVLPLKIYLGIGGLLIFLTAITVLVAQINLGAWNLGVAMMIAALKATLILLFFMHLKYDNKIYSILFVFSVLTLAVFIIFILFDTLNRGDLNPVRTLYKNQHAQIYDEDGKILTMQDRSKAESQSGMLSSFELANGIGPIKEEIKYGAIDMGMVEKAKTIFDSKCASCHKMDKRFAGPPLREVTLRRTGTFIMNQILNPEENVKRHPEGQKMLAEYFIYMTFQNVSKEDARALLEYLRWEATQSTAGEESKNES